MPYTRLNMILTTSLGSHQVAENQHLRTIETIREQTELINFKLLNTPFCMQIY